MRGLILLLVSLGLASAGRDCQDSSEERASDRAALAAARIDTQAFRLERLEAKLEKMTRRMDEVEHADESSHAANIKDRLDHLEGKWEFVNRK